MAHKHGESALGRHRNKLSIVLALTAAYLVAEVVAGLITNSLMLLADAGHMLTDVAGLALALLASKLAERPASPRRTYGYYRIEILAAAVNAVVLLGIAGYVLNEAYERWRSPPVIASGPMLVVGIGGLAVNVAGALLLHRAAGDSLNLRAAYFEMLADLVSSLGVVGGAILISTLGWYFVDPLLSAAIAVFIVPRTWRLLREAVNVLLEGTPSDLDIAAVRSAMLETPGVASVHDLHAWSLTSGMNALSAHVVLTPGRDHVAVRQALYARLTTGFKLHHVTLQMEQTGEPNVERHL